MKRLIQKIGLLVLVVTLNSCSSVKVASDYDKDADFNTYKTFAFYKTGIDQAEISDLDKRRILRAIEANLLERGFTKSQNPDLLVSIFTKSNQRVDVWNNNFGWGWGGWGWGGFGPYWGMGWNQPMVSTKTEGKLYIDLIDANKKELVWQGEGTGYLVTKSVEKKEARINEFVDKVMENYPPAIN